MRHKPSHEVKNDSTYKDDVCMQICKCNKEGKTAARMECPRETISSSLLPKCSVDSGLRHTRKQAAKNVHILEQQQRLMNEG